MLPISGAIFAGRFGRPDIFAKMTGQALRNALGDLSVEGKKGLSDKILNMCIYEESEFWIYDAEFNGRETLGSKDSTIRSRDANMKNETGLEEKERKETGAEVADTRSATGARQAGSKTDEADQEKPEEETGSKVSRSEHRIEKEGFRGDWWCTCGNRIYRSRWACGICQRPKVTRATPVIQLEIVGIPSDQSSKEGLDEILCEIVKE